MSEETIPDGTPIEPQPKLPLTAANGYDEASQEGMMPVQAFTSPAVAPDSTEPRLRLGRPPRVPLADLHKSAGGVGTALDRTQLTAESTDSAIQIAAAIGSALTPAWLGTRYPTLAIGSVPEVANFAAGAATGAAIGALLGGAAGAAIGAQVGAAMAAQNEATKKQLSEQG
jgi:hypothetical protein